MGRLKKSLGGRAVGVRHEMVPKPSRTEQTKRLSMITELRPRQHLERLVEGSPATGKDAEGVREMSHEGLSGVHAVHDEELLETVVGDLALDQPVRNDPVHSTPGFERGIGQHPHGADLCSPIDEIPAAPSNRATDLASRLCVARVRPALRTAEHADPPDPSPHGVQCYDGRGVRTSAPRGRPMKAKTPRAAPARGMLSAMRIVSLCPSITESIIELGQKDTLVGITRFCIHPAPVVRGIEKVGGTKDPKVERIRSLGPDLVLLNEEENRREDYEALVCCLRVEVSFPKTVGQVPDHLRWLGRLIGAEAEAERRASELEEALEVLEARRAAAGRTFRFAYLIWRAPWMAVGPDTYVDDLFRRAGGENVLDLGRGRYPVIELSELERRRADVVLLPDEPFPFRPKHVPEVAREVPSARIDLVSGDDACWHGVRSLRGVALARALLEQNTRG